MVDWLNLDYEGFRGFNVSLIRNQSIPQILTEQYPEFSWERNTKIPDISTFDKRRRFLDDFIATYFPATCQQEDLHRITTKGILEHPGGITLMNGHAWSPAGVLRVGYPELSGKGGIGAGDDGWERRIFVDGFILRWYEFVETQGNLVDITIASFLRHHGGRSIIGVNNFSTKNVFQQTYPELIHQFRCEHRGYWNDLKNNKLIEKVLRHFHIKNQEDFYKLSIEQLSEVYGKRIVKRNALNLIEYYYPDFEWDEVKFAERINKRSRQRWLGLKLREIFKEEKIVHEYKFRVNKKLIVFDFYLPERKLAIEYQGEQHYFSVLKWLPLEEQKQRDEDKRTICQQNGIQLIYVPYWWNNSTETLKDLVSL